MNGKAWLGRLLSRKAPDPAKARRKASRRPASPLRELEQEQAALRARLDRPRPYDQPGFTPLVQKDTHGRSFPSRHALSAAVLAMVWLYFYPAVGWCMIVIALLIAVVRVLTGVHHIRDVAAGLALGFACGFVGMWLL